MEYGQFCPIAKASELIGEKWTVLIIREILMGGNRFSELQRGLGTISPTLLTRRLADLETNGLIYRKTISGQRGHEYYPTEACKQLQPVLLSLGNWGLTWAHENLQTYDYDVELLLIYLERSIQTDKLPPSETIIQFSFSDMIEKANWWLIAENGSVEACDKDPGKDIDVYFHTTVKTMTDIWMKKISYREAKKAGELSITGNSYLAEHVSSWMHYTPFETLPPAEKIL
ncbi:MAG: helix-turn-helix domain-containing protein [Stappiaceae bacterium]